jgi:hypothetical protein
MRRPLATVLTMALLAVACGNDRPDADNRQATQPSENTSSSTAPPLPGERKDIYPYEGAKLAVAGVAADDTLKVRSGPGTDFNVVFELRPTATNATATGHNRSLPNRGFWSEITVDGRTGWANTAFLLQPGDVNDITATLYPTPADRPRERTMVELGRTVARDRAGDDPEPDIVIVDGPTLGDVGEVTVDIVGVGDDSVGGERLKIFAEPGGGGGGFTVRSVEATSLCRRGVTSERLCV